MLIKYHLLDEPPDSLPLLAWQLVLIQSENGARTVDPVLATCRGNQLYFSSSAIHKWSTRGDVPATNQLGLQLQWLGLKTLPALSGTRRCCT
jgi:hypothetical protein